LYFHVRERGHQGSTFVPKKERKRRRGRGFSSIIFTETRKKEEKKIKEGEEPPTPFLPTERKD